MQATWQMMHTEIICGHRFNLLDQSTGNAIKSTLIQYRGGHISKAVARMNLIQLAIRLPDPDKKVALCVEAIIKSSNDLNRTIESEVELGADVIHPFMQVLFVGDDEQRHTKCGDITIQCKRPDYIVEKLKSGIFPLYKTYKISINLFSMHTF